MISSSDINTAAREYYMADWKQLPTGNYPPTWENASDEIKDWVRRKVKIVLSAVHHSSVGEAR